MQTTTEHPQYIQRFNRGREGGEGKKEAAKGEKQTEAAPEEKPTKKNPVTVEPAPDSAEPPQPSGVPETGEKK